LSENGVWRETEKLRLCGDSLILYGDSAWAEERMQVQRERAWRRYGGYRPVKTEENEFEAATPVFTCVATS